MAFMVDWQRGFYNLHTPKVNLAFESFPLRRKLPNDSWRTSIVVPTLSIGIG
jgi:hypothetical protein